MTEFDTSRVCGFLYLFILLTSAMAGSFWIVPLNPEDAANALNALADGAELFLASIIVDLISHFCIIALAGTLYVSFSSYNKSLALIGTLWRVIEGILLAIAEGINAVLLVIAQEYVSTTGTEAVALEAIGRTLIIAEQWCYAIGMAFFALGSLLYYVLFVVTKAVPPKLGWFGVVASSIAVVETWLGLAMPVFLFGASENLLLIAFFVPIIIFEITLGSWLLRGGLESRQALNLDNDT